MCVWLLWGHFVRAPKAAGVSHHPREEREGPRGWEDTHEEHTPKSCTTTTTTKHVGRVLGVRDKKKTPRDRKNTSGTTKTTFGTKNNNIGGKKNDNGTKKKHGDKVKTKPGTGKKTGTDQKVFFLVGGRRVGPNPEKCGPQRVGGRRRVEGPKQRKSGGATPSTTDTGREVSQVHGRDP